SSLPEVLKVKLPLAQSEIYEISDLIATTKTKSNIGPSVLAEGFIIQQTFRAFLEGFLGIDHIQSEIELYNSLYGDQIDLFIKGTGPDTCWNSHLLSHGINIDNKNRDNSKHYNLSNYYKQGSLTGNVTKSS